MKEALIVIHPMMNRISRRISGQMMKVAELEGDELEANLSALREDSEAESDFIVHTIVVRRETITSLQVFVISGFCQYNLFKIHIRVCIQERYIRTTLFFASCRGKNVITH
jgi:hypothetical protein